MSDRLSTKAGVFESGEKDVMGVQYKDGRVIACRNSKLEDYTVADGTEVVSDRALMNLKELRSIKLPIPKGYKGLLSYGRQPNSFSQGKLNKPEINLI